MLTRPQVQRYAHQSGLRDIMIAEKEIILTYALQLLAEGGVLAKLAFKGGTCLRKMFVGSQGRFSTDLDFTALAEHEPAEMIIEMMVAFDEPFHGVTFALTDSGHYETQDGLSWGVNPTYKHEWNPGGESEINLQISRRETPTLATQSLPQIEQSYFAHLPFAPTQITTLAFEELLAEKIRACYQRSKARDIYDLGTFVSRPLNQPLIRRLVVLKLWQSKDSFDPERLRAKLEDGRDFDWDDLGQLVRRDQRIDPKAITAACLRGLSFLADMSEEEKSLAADRYRREHALWKRLQTELPAG